jgi:hypothetical protein
MINIQISDIYKFQFFYKDTNHNNHNNHNNHYKKLIYIQLKYLLYIQLKYL